MRRVINRQGLLPLVFVSFLFWRNLAGDPCDSQMTLICLVNVYEILIELHDQAIISQRVVVSRLSLHSVCVFEYSGPNFISIANVLNPCARQVRTNFHIHKYGLPRLVKTYSRCFSSLLSLFTPTSKHLFGIYMLH